MRRPLLAAALAAGLALPACSSSSGPPASSPSTARPTSTRPSAEETTTAVDGPAESEAAWADVDERLRALAPEVGLLAARVSDDGTCERVHAVAPDVARPIGSQFKLWVLGTLAQQVAAGEVAWDQVLTLTEDDRSFGNGDGSLEKQPAGSTISVEEAATIMIENSDNTATDLLIRTLGRDAVGATAAEWTGGSTANDPFLTTKEMFFLHFVDGLGDAYLATAPDEREAFLAANVHGRPISDLYPGLDLDPHFIETIEWFATPVQVCAAFARLQQLAADPALSPIATIMTRRPALELDEAVWETPWYKGGSEAGVLALGWLATTTDGDTYVVQATLSDPVAALADDAITDLAALCEDVFELLASA